MVRLIITLVLALAIVAGGLWLDRRTKPVRGSTRGNGKPKSEL